MQFTQSEQVAKNDCLGVRNTKELAFWFRFVRNSMSLLIPFCLIFSSYLHANESLVVVVNKANQISLLSKKQIIDIYMGRYLSFPDGESVSPIDFPTNSNIKQQFYLQLVNQNERKIKSYWSRLLFSGRAKPPKEAQSLENAIVLIEQTSDAIAYLSREQVTSEMKIVFEF